VDVANDELIPSVLRARHGIPHDAPLLVIVARLQRWKGIHVVVQAVPWLLTRRPNLHLVIVGGEHPLEPDYRASLEALASRSGISRNVHFTGHHNRPRAWMAAADVVVHASSNEPFGIVVIEALASGVPLVATADGGPSEIITDGVNGLLVPFGDVPAIVESIERVLDDATFAHALAIAGRQRAAEFTPRRFATAVADAVRECAAG
ncbi:MAG: glycosyltransferase family 4 protein, partial [Polyangiaceae bacterium]